MAMPHMFVSYVGFDEKFVLICRHRILQRAGSFITIGYEVLKRENSFSFHLIHHFSHTYLLALSVANDYVDDYFVWLSLISFRHSN